jgi:hypothetical protein
MRDVFMLLLLIRRDILETVLCILTAGIDHIDDILNRVLDLQ